MLIYHVSEHTALNDVKR